MFEIYTMVSEIHDNVDLVLGVKNFAVEFKKELHMSELKFTFLNGPVSIFPLSKEKVKPKERKFLKVEAILLDEISVLVIIKLLRLDIYYTLIMKVKFEKNKAFLEVTNDSTKVVVLDPKRAVAILGDT